MEQKTIREIWQEQQGVLEDYFCKLIFDSPQMGCSPPAYGRRDWLDFTIIEFSIIFILFLWGVQILRSYRKTQGVTNDQQPEKKQGRYTPFATKDPNTD